MAEGQKASTVQPPKTVATPVAPAPGTSGSFFSQHKGLVIGGVLVLAAGAVLVYELAKKKKSSSTTTGTTTLTTGAATTTPTTNSTIYQELATDIQQSSTNTSSAINRLQTAFESYVNAQSSGAGSTATTTTTGSGTWHLTTTGSTSGSTSTSLQKAPTYSSFVSGGNTYTPVTLFTYTGSGDVYVKTSSTGEPIAVTVAQAKTLEHTGTRKYTQYTTYEKLT